MSIPSETIEIIENQRWYTFSGWSDQLQEHDPPSWSDVTKQKTEKKEDYKNFDWNVYKSEDYDEDGWIYAIDFNEEFGEKNMSTCVRSRVWIGTLSKNIDIIDLTEEEDMKSTIDSNSEGNGQVLVNDLIQRSTYTTEAPKIDNKSYFRSFTSAAFGVSKTAAYFAASTSKNVVSFAANTTKSAAVVTAKSVHEASAYVVDAVHTSAVSAIASDDSEKFLQYSQSSQSARKSGSNIDGKTNKTPGMSVRPLPNLAPIERQLVSICRNQDPNLPFQPSPKGSNEMPKCKECQGAFGISRFRYNCTYCGHSYCREHLPYLELLREYGKTNVSRICTSCKTLLEEKINEDYHEWRCERTRDYLKEDLLPYFNTEVDTAIHKAKRAAEGTLAAAKAVPLTATARMAVASADFIRKYGSTGLLGFILRHEFMESFNTIKEIMGDTKELSFQDAAIGMYYFMAANRGVRGEFPLREEEEHQDCIPVTDELLSSFLRYAPLALHAIYQFDILDVQRLCKLQSFSLIYASIESCDIFQPAYALVAHRKMKTAVVIIRGSKSVQDMLTDLRVAPHSVNHEDTKHDEIEEHSDYGTLDRFAHEGMLKAALWLKEQILPSLLLLQKQNYSIVLCGHSLGGGCASLLSIILKPEFPSLECYAYATPACIDKTMANSCKEYVHSVVLRDDVVPRIKPENINDLISHLSEYKQDWKNIAAEDITAFKDRALTLWAPKKRAWASHETSKKNPPNKSIEEVVLEPRKTPQEVGGTTSDWTITRKNILDRYNKLDKADEEDDNVEDSTAEKRKVHTQLYVPGTITHLYFSQGVYKAVHIDSNSSFLSTIVVVSNMLTDHLSQNYLIALKIAREIRRAMRHPPDWVPFGSHRKCMCCESPFTWNSTSSSEAQLNRDQHNCRKCGWLVCDGCSSKQISLPMYGINSHVRVCDRCYYELTSPPTSPTAPTTIST